MRNDQEGKNTIPSPANSDMTPASNEDVVSTLNGLIETCKDSQEGFKQAADAIDRSDVKSLFYEFAQQRSRFAGELQNLVQTMGGDPETSSSTLGALHRGWINIKSAVTGRNEKAILNEAERGEDTAKDTYRSALESGLPAHVLEVVRRQYESVLSAHDRVKALRDSAVDDMSSSASTGF